MSPRVHGCTTDLTTNYLGFVSRVIAVANFVMKSLCVLLYFGFYVTSHSEGRQGPSLPEDQKKGNPPDSSASQREICRCHYDW